MNSVCMKPSRMRLDFAGEGLPSFSEYIMDGFPSPQIIVDDDGNLRVQLEKDFYSQPTTDYHRHFPSIHNDIPVQDSRNVTTAVSSSTIVNTSNKMIPPTWPGLGSNPAISLVTSTTSHGHGIAQQNFNTTSSAGLSSNYVYSAFSDPLLVADSPPTTGVIQSTVSFPRSLPRPLLALEDPRFQNEEEEEDETSSIESGSHVTFAANRKSVSGSTSRKRGLDATSVLNMDDAEARKLELKRAKNREAAQRCQQRKQERIVRLENKVTKLREQNLALGQTVTALRDQIATLHRECSTHSKSGCQIDVPSYLFS